MKMCLRVSLWLLMLSVLFFLGVGILMHFDDKTAHEEYLLFKRLVDQVGFSLKFRIVETTDYRSMEYYIDGVYPNSPAERAGLEPNDEPECEPPHDTQISQGKKYFRRSCSSIWQAIVDNQGKSVSFKIKRDGKWIEKAISAPILDFQPKEFETIQRLVTPIKPQPKGFLDWYVDDVTSSSVGAWTTMLLLLLLIMFIARVRLKMESANKKKNV